MNNQQKKHCLWISLTMSIMFFIILIVITTLFITAYIHKFSQTLIFNSKISSLSLYSIYGIGLDPTPLQKNVYVAISPSCMINIMKYIKTNGFNSIRTWIPFSGNYDSFSKAANEANVKILLGIGLNAYENGIYGPESPKGDELIQIITNNVKQYSNSFVGLCIGNEDFPQTNENPPQGSPDIGQIVTWNWIQEKILEIRNKLKQNLAGINIPIGTAQQNGHLLSGNYDWMAIELDFIGANIYSGADGGFPGIPGNNIEAGQINWNSIDAQIMELQTYKNGLFKNKLIITESGIPHAGSIITNGIFKNFGNDPPGTITQKYILNQLNNTGISFFISLHLII